MSFVLYILRYRIFSCHYTPDEGCSLGPRFYFDSFEDYTVFNPKYYITLHYITLHYITYFITSPRKGLFRDNDNKTYTLCNKKFKILMQSTIKQKLQTWVKN